jgi:hypothetical protein
MKKRLRFTRQTQLADIVGPPPKTNIWQVRNVQSGVDLGLVRWFGRWRQYAFFPDAELVFEKSCLRRIAEFCEHATDRHRRRARSERREG